MYVRRLLRARGGRFVVVVIATLGLTFAGSFAVPFASASGSSSATRQIRANWEAFFSAKTSLAKRIALLQDGKAFAKILREQASSPLTAGASATVSKITLKGKSSATVRYTIDIGGQPALKNRTGTAVLQRKVWKVGASSFCSLLHLEGVKVAACQSASA